MFILDFSVEVVELVLVLVLVSDEKALVLVVILKQVKLAL